MQTETSVDLMSKSPDAFRTISEVADWLGIQAHVLRFWESKFTQVKPIKRAGGRRYYRPADMLLLGGIKRMLHDDGLTIKGVQKVLREEGMNYVAAMSAPLDELTQTEFADSPANAPIDAVAIKPEPEKAERPQSVVLPFEAARAPEPEQPEALDTAPETGPETAPDTGPETGLAPAVTDAPIKTAPEEESPVEAPESQTAAPDHQETRPADGHAPAETDEKDAAQPVETKRLDSVTPPTLDAASDIAPQPRDAKPDAVTADAQPDDSSADDRAATPPQDAPKPKPRIIDVSIDFAEEDIPAKPGAVSSALNVRNLTADAAADMAPLLSRLSELRAAMGAGRSLVSKD